MIAEQGSYPPAVREEFARLARECSACYQCGTCTSSCPSGRELYRGPRRIVRLILAGDIEAVLKSDDLWRCTGCGACTDVCRMEIDVTGILSRLRGLERAYGSAIDCPERAAAVLAAAHLRRKPRLDMMQFGVGMLARGHVPRDKIAAGEMGLRLAKQKLPLAHGGRERRQDGVSLPFYAGCALAQDRRLQGVVHDVAAGFGIRLEETDAGCCGHPSRGAVASRFHTEQTVNTACPACDASLQKSGMATASLWDTLTEHARRRGTAMQAAEPRFVPYVGCLSQRGPALASLATAAELAHVEMKTTYPSLHSGCCGALGGTYRGATKASAMLLEFAAAQDAPLVSPCSLCCDNLRSAARGLKRDVSIHFWPEFFRAAPTACEEQNDD